MGVGLVIAITGDLSSSTSSESFMILNQVPRATPLVQDNHEFLNRHHLARLVISGYTANGRINTIG
jgi:hypothetical protein